LIAELKQARNLEVAEEENNKNEEEKHKKLPSVNAATVPVKDEVNQDDVEGEEKTGTKEPKEKTYEKEEEEGDECPICLEILPKDTTKFDRWTCCGNGIHIHCFKGMESMKMRGTCPFCRAKTPTSEEEHVQYLRPWVKKKKAWAQSMMAQMYMEGKGVKQSNEMARILFDQAAQQGYVNAMCNLGFMYEHGNGVEQSYEKAFEYFEQAAQLGYAKAQYSLGVLSINGNGVRQDLTKVKSLWTKAAAQGDEDAIKGLTIFDKEKGRTTTTSSTSCSSFSESTSNQNNKILGGPSLPVISAKNEYFPTRDVYLPIHKYNKCVRPVVHVIN
jgi:hypothetical protein